MTLSSRYKTVSAIAAVKITFLMNAGFSLELGFHSCFEDGGSRHPKR